MTIEERLAILEQKVEDGFSYIKENLKNHLESHSKRENRLTTTIITISIGFITLLIKYLFFN